jgi:hypothetical protein
MIRPRISLAIEGVGEPRPNGLSRPILLSRADIIEESTLLSRDYAKKSEFQTVELSTDLFAVS